MRMMDWAGVKGLAAKFPVRGANLSPSAQNDLEVAKIMALIPDKDWNGVKSRAVLSWQPKRMPPASSRRG